MESRARRADWDPERVGDLGQRHVLVVMKDDDRPLLDRQSVERPLHLVSVGQVAGAVDLARFDRNDADAGDVGMLSLCLVVAGPDQKPVEPRVEAGGVTERREVAPRLQERRLDRVLGPIPVVNDPHRYGVETIDR